MQYDKNTAQEEAELTKQELAFAKSLEDALNQAIGDGDNVTSIWSHLKDDQRVRLAEGYLARYQTNTRYECKDVSPEADRATARQTPPPSDGPEHEAQATPSQSPAPTESPRTVPRGYPADFNPLAGFPGLEPARGGPSPEQIIAGALPGFGTHLPANALDILGKLLPGGYLEPSAQPAPQPAPRPAPRPQDIPPHPDPASSPGPETIPTADQDAGPAAPNFWPLWIDQQDILLKQCLKLMSGNIDDAQDALSEAMVKASTKFEDSMDEIRNHRAWLSRIVHNACIDLHRQNRRKAEYKEETHSTPDAPVSPMTAPPSPSPEETFLATEKFDQLEMVLHSLPEKLRKPLLMRCVQDRSYDEIASTLGLSNCAVRKRVQLARDHLHSAGIQ